MEWKVVFRKTTAVSLAAVLCTSAFGLYVSAAQDGNGTEYTRYDRLEQPSYRYTFDEEELAVVNFAPVWGDKEANVESMVEYIEEADEKGVKLLLFPEMCVTGYASSSNPDSEIYQMAVESAETIDGPTATTIATLADEYDMWIIYGGTEVVEGDADHAYNSAFACSPEGEVTSYQKITPVEGSWCTPGETPVLLDTEYGKVGLSICYDTYATPELGRYYAAKGCNILLNPTATSRSYQSDNDKGWEWYYKNRLESNSSREGYTILSANLVGGDGPKRADGTSTYNFPGGSVIMQSQFNGPVYYAGLEEGQTQGSVNEDADIMTGQEGLLTNVASLTCTTGSTCTNQDFIPEQYAQWYAELADKQEAGDTLRYSSNVTDGPKAAVVNMAGIWGDKEANIQNMLKYVQEAGEAGVDILVFPETVLTGYEYKDPATDPLEDVDVAMQVALAELIPGPTTEFFSQYAQQYDMYIIFGMTELDADGPIYEDGVEKCYNSAAVLYPDGKIESYQKMHRAGSENRWSVPGDTPYMFDTEWGKIGIDICRDGHFYPELGRYYAAMGCTILIHPTATTGNPWYRETRIGSYTDRDGMAAITCNLLGPDGTYNEETGRWSGGIFNSTSLIITKYHDPETGRTSYDPQTGYAIDLNGTGSASQGFEERGTSPEGLEIADMNLSGCGFSISNFNPRLFSKMYDELATLYRGGYETMYTGETVSTPATAIPTALLTQKLEDAKNTAEEAKKEVESLKEALKEAQAANDSDLAALKAELSQAKAAAQDAKKAVEELKAAQKPSGSETNETKATLNVAKKTLTVKKGKKIKVKASTSPTAKITYKSKNKKIAEVTAKGVIKGKKKGRTTITVKANGLTKKIKVRVK